MRNRLRALEAEVIELEYSLAKGANKAGYDADARKAWQEGCRMFDKLNREISQLQKELKTA